MDASKKPIERQYEAESVKWKENKMAVVVPATETSNHFLSSPYTMSNPRRDETFLA